MNTFNLHRSHWTTRIFILTVILSLGLSVARATPALAPPPELLTGCWVDYAPTNFAPPTYYPNATQIGQDLNVLKSAGFTGIVTYGSEKILGTRLPQVAHQKGINLIMGIYDPTSTEEYNNAVAAQNDVVGYVVGNEGLNDRYDRATLETTITNLKADTGKPVTTSEQWGDYQLDSTLLDVGDWVFPNTHPFFANPPFTDPTQAASWTQDRYDQLDMMTTQEIVFKEVGLPSAGGSNLSPANQAEYYRQLRWNTHVKFAYFEAFDQPWKSYLGAYESHWGMFASNRSPKPVRQYVCGGVPNLTTPADDTITTNNRPTFRWGSTGAAKYEMQLYTDSPPSQTVVNAPVLAYTPDCALLTRDYHWRVRAIDSLGNALDWSDIRDLTIQSSLNAAPPRNSYILSTPTLTWNQMTSATQYQIQVGCNLNDPLEDTELSPDKLSYTTGVLLSGTYNWHVRAKDNHGSWGSWSPMESFTVDLP